jgi:tetratricopeptide (TPR) repeat protein
LDCSHVAAWFNKGSIHLALGQRDQAKRCFEHAILIDDRFVSAWMALGGMLADESGHEDAISCYDRALRVDAVLDDAWLQKSRALNSLGRYSEAIDCCDRVLCRDPTNSDALRDKAVALANKGVDLWRAGDLKAALRHWQSALEFCPALADVWQFRGYALEQLGRRLDAIKSHVHAVFLHPDLDGSWTAIDSYLQFPPVEGMAEWALEQKVEQPSDVEAWLTLGVVLAALGDTYDALNCFDNATKSEPKSASTWFGRGLFLLHCCECHADALECFRKARQLGMTKDHLSSNAAGETAQSIERLK